jgi:chromosome segregation ATPase
VPSPHHPDNDPTDELPVLSDVALAEYESQVSAGVDDTGERTLQMPGPAPHGPGGDFAPPLASLERDVAELTARWSRLESQFAESSAAVAGLTEQLAAAQRALGESAAGRQRLTREIEDKEQQLASLSEQYKQLRQDNAALREAVDRFAADKESLSTQLAAALEDSGARAELDAQRQTLEAQLTQAQARIGELERGREAEREQARARTAELEAELTAAEQLIEELAPAEPAKGADADVEAYRAEIAALSDYITNRRSYWDDMEARLASQRERIAELEAEVEHRSERQQAAERTAQREAALAAELKERLSETARRLEAAQDKDAPRGQDDDAALAEARVEQLEQQLRAARAELDARERALGEAQNEAAEAAGKLAALADEAAAARADSESARAELQALEARLSEQDQETELHKERLAQLQRELGTQLDGLRSVEQEPAAELAASGANGTDMHAMLVCLTSERPQEYALAKPVMTIGRSGDCDIQIPTHFVSREHARLLVDPKGIAIEDLGSTNGVFVNSVRVERQALHDGDWITIGETQFRFLSGERA